MTEPTTGYILTPEPPAGPLTARNLEDFAQCPRKYLLSFFTTRAQTREFIGGPAALHRAVRAALLELHAAGGPANADPQAVLQAFEVNWNGSACKDSKEEEDLHRDGRRILSGYSESPALGTGPVTTDLRLEGEIRGHVFVAVADLALAEPPTLVRFTTSRRPPSPSELADDLSWALLYLLGLRHFGVDELTCVMADLRKGRQVDFALDAAQQSHAEARAVALAERIRREREFAPVTGKDCRWCRSRPDCPAHAA